MKLKYLNISLLTCVTALVALSAQVFSILCIALLQDSATAGADIGGNMAVSLLPSLLLTFGIGNTLDRFSKHKILAAVLFTSVVVLLALFQSQTLTGANRSLFFLNVCTFVLSAVSGVVTLVAMSMIPAFTERKRIVTFNSILQVARLCVAMLVGWLGTGPIKALGVISLQLVILGSLWLSGILALLVRQEKAFSPQTKLQRSRTMLLGFKQTLQDLKGDSDLQAHMTLLLAYNLFATALVPVLPLMQGGARGFPLFFAMIALGGFLGNVIAPFSLTGRIQPIGFLMFAGCARLALSLNGNEEVKCVMILLESLGASVFSTLTTASIQISAKPHQIGRILSLLAGSSAVVASLSMLLVGHAVDGKWADSGMILRVSALGMLTLPTITFWRYRSWKLAGK